MLVYENVYWNETHFVAGLPDFIRITISAFFDPFAVTIAAHGFDSVWQRYFCEFETVFG